MFKLATIATVATCAIADTLPGGIEGESMMDMLKRWRGDNCE